MHHPHAYRQSNNVGIYVLCRMPYTTDIVYDILEVKKE